MRIFKCNMCGKDYNPKCEQPLSIDHVFTYPSKNEGEAFSLDICPYCQDAFAEMVSAFCKISPMESDEDI